MRLRPLTPTRWHQASLTASLPWAFTDPPSERSRRFSNPALIEEIRREGIYL
jgi:hypothetical protein